METNRLKLIPYKKEDLGEYHILMSSAPVWAYSTHDPHDQISQSELKLTKAITDYENNGFGFQALYEKESNRFIGEAGVLSFSQAANRCVVGYNLLPCFWGQGYATEITKRLVAYAFDVLQVERIEALVQKDNVASCRVLEKSGFKREGVLRNFSKNKDVYLDVCYYGMISSDFVKEDINGGETQ